MQSLTVAKRHPKRSRVFLAAVVDAGQGPFEVRIRDISRSGALLECDSPPDAGAEVRLTCGDAVVDGRVAWADRHDFGLEFSTPLLLGRLMDHTGAKLKLSAPRAYRSSDAGTPA